MRAREQLLVGSALHRRALRVAFLCLGLVTFGAVSPAAAQEATPDDEVVADDSAPTETPERVAERAQLTERLESGVLSPSELAETLLALALLSDDAEAVRRLQRALAIDPEIQASSEAQRPALDPLREGASAVQIVLDASRDDGQIELRVENAPSDFIWMITVAGRGGFSRQFAWRAAPRLMAVPVEALPLHARALDEHGNVVALAGPPPLPTPEVEVEVEAAPTPAPMRVAQVAVEDAAEEEESLLESPWLWITVGVIAVLVGVVVGVSASSDRFVLNAPVIR